MPTKGKGKGKLSPELQAKYEEAFDAIDADGAGSISKSELVAILAADDVSDAHVDECLAKFDTDRDGEMDKEEYFDFVFGSMLEQARAFMKAADTSGDGKLTKDELATCFANIGFPAEMAEEAMAQCDDDGSGTLSVDEVCNYLLEV